MTNKISGIPRIETFLAPTDAHEGESFEGLPVYAMPGLHAHIQKLATPLFPSGARVLDLGCGAGALAGRLGNAGFDVTCCDAHPDVFRLHERFPFVAADLNGDFSQAFGNPFEAITAVEIIEHLENPWHFLRQCHALLAPGGNIVLTTPNIDTPRSILEFVKKSTFKGFADHDFQRDGHITQLSQWQLGKCAAAAGLRLDAIEAFGPPWGSGFRHLGAKALWLLAAGNPSRAGAIVVALGRRLET